MCDQIDNDWDVQRKVCHQVEPVNEGDDEGEELRVESGCHRFKTLQSSDFGT